MGFQFQSVAALSSSVIADFSIDYTQLGLLIGLYLLPGIVIAYPGGLLGQYFGDKRIAVIGMALMVAGGISTATGEYPVVLVGRLISGVGAVLLNVLLTKMTIDWFIGREIGTALAVLVSSWPVGMALPWSRCRGSPSTLQQRLDLPVRQLWPPWYWYSLLPSTVCPRLQSCCSHQID
jgi:MFS family permease